MYGHEGNKNKLTPQNISDIVTLYADRKSVSHLSAVIDNSTIATNGYNLSVSRYVEVENKTPETNIKELNRHIEEIVSNENRLRNEINAIIAELEENIYE